MYKLIVLKFIALFFIVSHVQASADGVVIVNPANSAALSKSDVQNIFLAKAKSFPDGVSVSPVNLSENNATRSEFEDAVCEKSDSQMKSYWAKLLFTGKAIPIKQLDGDQEVIDFVSKNRDAIGYVDSSSVTDSVKVVLEF